MSRFNLPNQRNLLGWLLLGYWLLLFTATHVPIPVETSVPKGGDKVVHLAIYAGLTFLLALWLSARHQLGWKAGLLIFFVAVGFAMLDELLQIPVGGRHADVRDWIADCAGGLIGLIAFGLLYRLRPGWWERDAESKPYNDFK